MRWLWMCLLLLLGLGWSATASAWEASGHRLVCEIALLDLTPHARGELDRLLALHPASSSTGTYQADFGWGCTYPDSIEGRRRRNAEHYVNYPRSLANVSGHTGCPLAPRCIVSAIADDFERLRDGSSGDRERAEALIYLGHWVGDIHQPLHSSFSDDRGGGRIDTEGLCYGTLHSVWDSCILELRSIPSADGSASSAQAVRALATAWATGVTDVHRVQWLESAPWQWSAESHQIARTPELQYCYVGSDECRYDHDRNRFAEDLPLRRVVRIDSAYADWATPIIQMRITQAGLRLAHLLNHALDPDYPAIPG